MTEQEQKDIGFRNDLYTTIIERTLLEVSTTILTCTLATTHGLATSLAGGTHHAFRSKGTGFTIINDIAVASQHLLKSSLATKVLVIDLDVHQGDGTASFSSDPASFLHGKMSTLSVHSSSNFPFKKGDSTYDVALPDGTGDEEYMAAVRASVLKALDEVGPDFVIYIAGVDVWEGDKLGRLAVSMSGMESRDAFVIREVVGRDVPLACVVGGGYEEDVKALARRHGMVSVEAAKVWRKKEMYKRIKKPN